MKGLAALEPADADVSAVADAIVKVIDVPFGRRPFRVHIDPSQDGAEIVNGIADREGVSKGVSRAACVSPRPMAARSAGLRPVASSRQAPGHRAHEADPAAAVAAAAPVTMLGAPGPIDDVHTSVWSRFIVLAYAAAVWTIACSLRAW